MNSYKFFHWRFIVSDLMHKEVIKYQNPSTKLTKESCMLEEFHAKPMKINRNNYDRKCQRNQETVISAIN